MPRTRRMMPVAVLLLVTTVVILPYILAWRDTPSAKLPIPSWSRLIEVTARSLTLPIAGATIAAVVACLVVVTGYFVCRRPLRRVLFAAYAAPFLFPPVIVAQAVHVGFGQPQLLLSATLTALPAAVFGQAVSLRFIDADTLMLARSLGLGPWQSWKLTLFPAWVRGAGLGWLGGVFFLLSDPGIYDLYGGDDSFLASHILRTVAGGAPGPAVGRSALLMLVLTLIMTVIVLHPRIWRGVRVRTLTGSDKLSQLIYDSRVPWWAKAVAGTVSLAAVGTIGWVLWTIGRGCLRAASRGTVPTTALFPTIIVIVVAVPLSVACALVFAIALTHARGALKTYGRYLVVIMVLTSPTALGALLATAFRAPVEIGDHTLIPAIVGGGSTAGGWIGLFLAAVAVCLPLSTLLLLGLLSLGSTEAAEAARNLGAGPGRVLFTIELPYIVPMIVASLCVETSALLTNLSPLVFVQPGGVELATPALLTLAAGGQADQAFALAVVTGLITCGAIVSIGGLVTAMIDSSTNNRHWRKK